jgi:hypothetical protein
MKNKFIPPNYRNCQEFVEAWKPPKKKKILRVLNEIKSVSDTEFINWISKKRLRPRPPRGRPLPANTKEPGECIVILLALIGQADRWLPTSLIEKRLCRPTSGHPIIKNRAKLRRWLDELADFHYLEREGDYHVYYRMSQTRKMGGLIMEASGEWRTEDRIAHSRKIPPELVSNLFPFTIEICQRLKAAKDLLREKGVIDSESLIDRKVRIPLKCPRL